MHNSLDSFVGGALREFDVLEAGGGERAGEVIGPYRLVEELGQGGFGTVWLAEQTQPVRRSVALKIIKAGMDTREVIARFSMERQALAVLDHPHIAKVFDAGATPAGRPYFVMELVRGESLTQYCNAHALPLGDRLGLFAEVCRAVQHAHQKGIIHRDLKPSNLLVTEMDGKAVPKVIDFGIAKATGEESLSENMLLTRMDRRMGTPAYMSPEQAEPGMDIDTRSDIYSLGIVLYELLTGQVPFQIGPNGRGKHEDSAQRPSTRIKTFSKEQLQKLSEAHGTETPKLLGLVRGDLDWIVMKAIEHDRARRYDSANALAADILAFLGRQPVSARPPTRWYVLTRFAQRNKLAVGAVAAIMMVLVAGIAISTWMYLKEKRALTRSEQVSRFMTEILAQAGPSKAMGDDTTMMRKILDQTAERIGRELNSQPEVAAELRGVIAATYEEIGEYQLALAQSEEALRLQRLLHAEDHERLAAAIMLRGSNFEYLGRRTESERDFREALAMQQRLFGDDDERTARTHAMLAWTLMKTRRAKEAVDSAELAMKVWRKNPRLEALKQAPKTLVAVYINTNRVEKSVEVSYEHLAILREMHGAEHPDIANCLQNLGYTLNNLRRYDEAEPHLREALRQDEKFYKGRSPYADHAYASLSRIAAGRKQWEKQIEYARLSAAAARVMYPPEHPYYREGMAVLARALMEHAERLAETDAPSATEMLDELAVSSDFQNEVKAASGWISCLRGRVLLHDPAKHPEARAMIESGIAAMKKRTEPAAEDKRRLAKAEAMLAR